MKKPPAVIQPNLALSCAELAHEIAHGPAFFDAKGDLTEAVTRYTGGRTTQDPERVAFVGALKLLGYSDRKICELAKCDVRSIPVMVQDLEKSGRIPALKERLIGIVGRNAEQSGLLVDQLVAEALEGDRTLELSAMLKAAGQVADKLVEKNQLLTGCATERVETVNGARADEREAWFRANAIPIEVAIDSQSSGFVGNAGEWGYWKPSIVPAVTEARRVLSGQINPGETTAKASTICCAVVRALAHQPASVTGRNGAVRSM